MEFQGISSMHGNTPMEIRENSLNLLKNNGISRKISGKNSLQGICVFSGEKLNSGKKCNPRFLCKKHS